jgi:exportin-1
MVTQMCLQNVDVLKDQEAVKQLSSILKTNVRACKALGHPYVLQVRQYDVTSQWGGS